VSEISKGDVDRIIRAIHGVGSTLGWIALWCFFIMVACCEMADKVKP
jgi:hypothetical protein